MYTHATSYRLLIHTPARKSLLRSPVQVQIYSSYPIGTVHYLDAGFSRHLMRRLLCVALTEVVVPAGRLPAVSKQVCCCCHSKVSPYY